MKSNGANALRILQHIFKMLRQMYAKENHFSSGIRSKIRAKLQIAWLWRGRARGMRCTCNEYSVRIKNQATNTSQDRDTPPAHKNLRDTYPSAGAAGVQNVRVYPRTHAKPLFFLSFFSFVYYNFKSIYTLTHFLLLCMHIFECYRCFCSISNLMSNRF